MTLKVSQSPSGQLPPGQPQAEQSPPGQAKAEGRPNSNPGGRRRKTNFWTHFILILAVFIVASPLLFALVKATQTGAQVTGPSLIPGLHFLDNARAAWVGAGLG